jgi:hypothetical protein
MRDLPGAAISAMREGSCHRIHPRLMLSSAPGPRSSPRKPAERNRETRSPESRAQENSPARFALVAIDQGKRVS